MSKICLCMIVGNEEAVIERFLRSFAPIVDELKIVKAIGTANSDYTYGVVGHVCRELNIPFSDCHYTNKEPWNHVDDFGAARQKAWGYGGNTDCDYLMWADADDLLDSSAIPIIKQACDEGKYDVFLLPYHVRGDDQIVLRERIVRNDGCSSWQYPVHESLKFSRDVSFKKLDAIIRHAPLDQKESSLGRNKRILEHSVAEMPRNLFYLHQEAFQRGDKGVAEVWGKAALESPNLDCVMEYETLLNMASLCSDPKEAKNYAARAFYVMPDRREALALLTTFNLIDGKYREAHRTAKIMMGIPEPDRTYWTLNRPWYGYKGTSLYCQTLRRLGKEKEASEIEASVLQKEKDGVSVIHYVYGDPANAIAIREQRLSVAKNPNAVDYIFTFEDKPEYKPLTWFKHRKIAVGTGPIVGWNLGRGEANEFNCVLVHDNTPLAPGWDRETIDNLKEEKGVGSLTLSNGAMLPYQVSMVWTYSDISNRDGVYLICGKEGHSEDANFQEQHQHYELGWEVNTTHVAVKRGLSEGKYSRKNIIVTLPGREFLYLQFDRVITWEKYCEETRKTYGTPHLDASSENTIDLCYLFQTNKHCFPAFYFAEDGLKYDGKGWEDIQNIHRGYLYSPGKFICVAIRNRKHQSERNTDYDYAYKLLSGLRKRFDCTVYVVGLGLPDYGLEGVYGASLKDWVEMIKHPDCIGVVGPHTGTMACAGLFAPEGRKLLMAPLEDCPSIDGYFPTGMSKGLNLNGNIRKWLPVGLPAEQVLEEASVYFSEPLE